MSDKRFESLLRQLDLKSGDSVLSSTLPDYDLRDFTSDYVQSRYDILRSSSYQAVCLRKGLDLEQLHPVKWWLDDDHLSQMTMNDNAFTPMASSGSDEVSPQGVFGDEMNIDKLGDDDTATADCFDRPGSCSVKLTSSRGSMKGDQASNELSTPKGTPKSDQHPFSGASDQSAAGAQIREQLASTKTNNGPVPDTKPRTYRGLLLKLHQVQASCCRLYFSMTQICELWKLFTIPMSSTQGQRQMVLVDEHTTKTPGRLCHLVRDAMYIRIELLMSLFHHIVDLENFHVRFCCFLSLLELAVFISLGITYYFLPFGFMPFDFHDSAQMFSDVDGRRLR